MKALFFTAMLSSALSAATADDGAGTWRWEVSADSGTTWHGDRLDVLSTQDSVLVRCIASWNSDAGIMFAQAAFDALWQTLGTSGPSDQVTDAHFSGAHLNGNANHPCGPTRFGHVIKIDDLRDTLPPGQGTRFLHAFQNSPLFEGFDYSNPIVLYQFRVLLDGTPGERVATSIFYPPSGGNATDRFMRLYTSPNGASALPLMTIEPVTLSVIPCAADFNRDGQDDFFDYLDFAQAFTNEDPAADFNQDSQIDFFDYLDFIQVFSEGCLS